MLEIIIRIVSILVTTALGIYAGLLLDGALRRKNGSQFLVLLIVSTLCYTATGLQIVDWTGL